VIQRAIHGLHEYLERKIREQRSAEQLLRRTPALADRLNHRQLALLSHAMRHAGHGYTVKSHERSHRVTTQTARTDLLKLAEFELLEQRKRGRAFVFHAPGDLPERIRNAGSRKSRSANCPA
jgi:Fic family protein